MSQDSGKKRSGPRRLIAGLRITRQDMALLEAVRPLFPEAASAGELAYQLWRRGLELALAELASLGGALPPALDEEILATLVSRRLLLALPLLRRTGRLALLGLDLPAPIALPNALLPALPIDAIDDTASAAITDLGGSDFL